MKKHRYLLANLIEKQQVGEEFQKWPLHVTLMPWFEFENEVLLVEKLDTLFSTMDSFLYLGGEQDMFGPKKNVPVFKVKNNSPMRTVHKQIMTLLSELGAKIDDPYVGDNFFSHITVRNRDLHLTNVQFKLDSVDLILATKEWPKKVRKSITRFDLKS